MDVSGWMIRSGFSFVDRKNTYERKDAYLLFEDEAKDEERGLWADTCDYNPVQTNRIIPIE
ncbi:hypothetical protein FJZ28_00310 [Candidatus Peregrinibacteria bacterium]|nr:hypothetical protein [Candidatus Peregrinibacteria bacterium]